jgi:hypothetical protein
MRCNKIEEIQRENLPRTAVSQALRNGLVGAAE